jgi:hypothetical protein
MGDMSAQDHPTVFRRMIRATLREWLVWVLLWCALRFLLLATFADVFGYGEELEKACAAKAMLDGLAIPHHQLAYQYYEGGGFVVSHLDALAFALLGESLLAVKLVALALGAVILAVSWRLCERLGGRTAARVFAALFIFAPISVQKLSLLTLGVHFHALLFVALVLDATARIILERDLRPRRWLTLGLAAGFGLFFSYQLVLTIAVAAGALIFSLRSALLERRTWFVALGFAIGVSPMCWMLAHVGRSVFDIHGAEWIGEGGAAKLDRVQAFFVSILAGRGALDLIGIILLCVSPLLGALALRTSSSRHLRVGVNLALLHLALFMVAYLAGGFTVGRVYHYFVLNRLVPLWWLATLLVSLGAAAAWRSRRKWELNVAGLFVGGLALAGATDLLREVRGALAGQSNESFARAVAGNLVTLARTKGYAYPKYLYKISPHLKGSSADKLRAFQGFKEPEPTTALLHEGIALALYGDASRELGEILRELRDAGIEDQRGFCLGLGLYLRGRFPKDIAARVHGVEQEPPAIRDALIEGLGCAGLGLLATEDRLAREVRIGIDSNLPEAYFVGLGRRMVDAFGNLSQLRYFEMSAGPWMLERARAETFVREQPALVASALMRGYDAARRERSLGPSK